MEAMLKSKQLRGREREYLVKWKGYHPIEASWVNESDMEHAQEAIEKFHTRPAKKRRNVTTLLWPSVGGEAQHLGKVRIWSPPGLPNVQSLTARPKTPRIEEFLVLLKRS